jgi:hypothetical protein
VPVHVHPTVPPVPARTPAAPPLLVTVRTVADLDGVLQDAAGRAAAEDRPLLVALVAPPAPLTIDAAIHARRAALKAALRTAVVAAATRGRAGLDIAVIEVRARRPGLDSRLDALVRRHHAERHPDPLAGHPEVGR